MPEDSANTKPVAQTGATLPPVGPDETKTPAFRAPESAAASSVAAAAAPTLKDLIGETKEEYDARMAEFKKLRAENEKLSKQIDDAEKAKMVEQGQFKELYEKEVASRKQAEGRAREKLLRSEVRAYAVAEGILDPDMADLIPTKNLKLNEDTGEYDNIKTVIAEHKAAKPQWYKAAAPVTTGSPNAAPSPEAAAAVDVSKMNPKEYAEYKARFVRGLKVGKLTAVR